MTEAEVPAWVRRWKGKLPEKLRETVAVFADSEAAPDISELAPRPPLSPAPMKQMPAVDVETFAPSPSPAKHFAPVASPAPAPRAEQENSNPNNIAMPPAAAKPSIFKRAEPPSAPDASSSVSSTWLPPSDSSDARTQPASALDIELNIERRRRQVAEESRNEATERAAVLSMQVDGLRAEIERLQMVLQRVDVSSCETAADAQEMAEMFKRMAAEAEGVAEEKAAAEDAACRTPGGTYVECVPSPKTARQKELEEITNKEVYDPEYAAVQFNFMALQYDDIFSMLEKREDDSTLVLYRADWLRKKHALEDLDELLPKISRDSPLPEEARVSAKELRSIFAKAYGGGGYRKVDLPFITLTQFWVCSEHPDPEEETLQGVIQYLNERWESFTEQDVGIYIDLGKPQSAQAREELEAVGDEDATEAVLWLVTSRARTKMAAAHHEAFLTNLEKHKAAAAAASPRASPRMSTPRRTGAATAGFATQARAEAEQMAQMAQMAEMAQMAKAKGEAEAAPAGSLFPAAEGPSPADGIGSARSESSSSGSIGAVSSGHGSEEML